MINYSLYHVTESDHKVKRELDEMIPKSDLGMHYKLDCKTLPCCHEIFFTASEENKCLSRIWMGYGKHEKSVANWGAVFTLEEYRGQGICGKLLSYCFECLPSLEVPPLALFCTAGTRRLADLYGKFGFVPAIHGWHYGPLYRPLGNSPTTFQTFCNQYYTETKYLKTVPATFDYRNEIDCLLKFALTDIGLEYGINGETDLADILMKNPNRAKIILTAENRCVGWILDGKSQIHPNYCNTPIIESD